MNIDAFTDKILFFDIETSLMEVYTFHIGRKVSISHDQIKKDMQVICISYMAEGWKQPKTLVWDNGNDESILRQFQEIAQQYPVLVAQNGDNFDIKVLNGRMWCRQLTPFKNICSLDTLKFSRQNMRLTSHKLDYKLKVLGKAGKHPMGISDWINVQQGDPTALSKMARYCAQDVLALRTLFWSILPYVNKLPISLGVLLNGNRDGCPQCGSGNPYIFKNGLRPSHAGARQRWICKKCGNDWTDTRLKSTTDRNHAD